MKQIIVIPLMVLSILLAGCMTFGNAGESEPKSPPAYEQEMKEAYQRQFVTDGSCTEKDLSVDYYGTYEGVYIGFVNGPWEYPAVVERETIGETEFVYASSQRLMACKDGQMLPLKDAYTSGWLTDDGIKDVLAYYKTQKPSLFGDDK
ncbi:MAG: hypothetical protein E7439_02515 [Ruminococcaceae bacterium]|nr:hypothetical protein [Oscillospiraceae bacterium]